MLASLIKLYVMTVFAIFYDKRLLMIQFNKPYRYTLEQVSITLKFAMDTLDESSDELFRVSATEHACQQFEEIINKTDSYKKFKQKLSDLTSQDCAFLMNKVFRESEILNFESLKVVGARDALVEKLNGVFKLTAVNQSKNGSINRNYFRNMGTALEGNLKQTVLGFLRFLVDEHQIESAQAIHNYLFLAQKVVCAKNDTNLEVLSSILGASLMQALECHGRLSIIPTQDKSRNSSANNYLLESYFFSEIMKFALQMPCFKKPFPDEPENYRELYPVNEMFCIQAQNKYNELIHQFRKPERLPLMLGQLGNSSDSFAGLNISPTNAPQDKKKTKYSRSKSVGEDAARPIIYRKKSTPRSFSDDSATSAGVPLLTMSNVPIADLPEEQYAPRKKNEKNKH